MKDIELVSIDLIMADPSQPRQEFEPTALNQLKKSIALKGILNPLVVEQNDDGKYLIIDGERRYRASKLLGLRELPVRIEKRLNSVERLILRFHLQEHHRAWSHFDKARAIKSILDSGEMKLSEVADILGVPDKTIQALFTILTISTKSQELLDNKRIPFTYVHRIAIMGRKLEAMGLGKKRETFEAAMIDKVERAVIEKTTDIMSYSVAMDKGGKEIVDSIIKIKDYSPEQALTESNAGIERAYAKLMNNLSWVEASLSAGIKNSTFKMITPEGFNQLKRLISFAQKFMKLSEFEE